MSLTAGQIIAAIATGCADRAEVEAIDRQVQYWARSGIIPLMAPRRASTGRGRRRQYSEEVVYHLAVAVDLAKWTPSLDFVGAVLGQLWSLTNRTDDPAAKLWRSAIGGAPDVFVVVRFCRYFPDPASIEVTVMHRTHLAEVAEDLDGWSVAIVPISDRFSKINSVLASQKMAA